WSSDVCSSDLWIAIPSITTEAKILAITGIRRVSGLVGSSVVRKLLRSRIGVVISCCSRLDVHYPSGVKGGGCVMFDHTTTSYSNDAVDELLRFTASSPGHIQR